MVTQKKHLEGAKFYYYQRNIRTVAVDTIGLEPVPGSFY